MENIDLEIQNLDLISDDYGIIKKLEAKINNIIYISDELLLDEEYFENYEDLEEFIKNNKPQINIENNKLTLIYSLKILKKKINFNFELYKKEVDVNYILLENENLKLKIKNLEEKNRELENKNEELKNKNIKLEIELETSCRYSQEEYFINTINYELKYYHSKLEINNYIYKIEKLENQIKELKMMMKKIDDEDDEDNDNYWVRALKYKIMRLFKEKEGQNMIRNYRKELEKIREEKKIEDEKIKIEDEKIKKEVEERIKQEEIKQMRLVGVGDIGDIFKNHEKYKKLREKLLEKLREKAYRYRGSISCEYNTKYMEKMWNSFKYEENKIENIANTIIYEDNNHTILKLIKSLYDRSYCYDYMYDILFRCNSENYIYEILQEIIEKEIIKNKNEYLKILIKLIIEILDENNKDKFNIEKIRNLINNYNIDFENCPFHILNFIEKKNRIENIQINNTEYIKDNNNVLYCIKMINCDNVECKIEEEIGYYCLTKNDIVYKPELDLKLTNLRYNRFLPRGYHNISNGYHAISSNL